MVPVENTTDQGGGLGKFSLEIWLQLVNKTGGEQMKYFLITLMLVAFGSLSSAHGETISSLIDNEVDLNAQLTLAENDPSNHYLIRISPKVDGTSFRVSATYDISTSVTLQGEGVKTETTGRNIIITPGAGFSGPLFRVMTGARLSASGLEPDGFANSGDGGTVDVEQGGSFVGDRLKFKNSSSMGNGGAVNCGPNSYCHFRDSRFFFGHAAKNGGGISVENGARLLVENSLLRANSAGIFGCHINNEGGDVTVVGSLLSEKIDLDRCINVGGENPFGRFTLRGVHWETDVTNDALDTTDTTVTMGSIVYKNPRLRFMNTQQAPVDNSVQSQCNDFGSGQMVSEGFNMDSDGSCFLNHATDLPNTDPLISYDNRGIPQPLAGSPMIESGPVDFVNNELPCIYKDLNGLGRPQDFDLDGVFTCDRGPVEVQGGVDIGAPQSAAFYDTGRNGEGAFVEILENGIAVVSFYTYSPDGMNMAWFVGSGQVKGNSVVVDEMQKATGGVFGAGFDPGKIVRTRVGGMSLVFPDCNAIGNPGRLNFTADPDSGFENLLQKASRLTSIYNCDGAAPAANVHRSGAFYAPERSGEGIFVQWLSDGRVVLVFYTFDTDGNPFWLTSVSGDALINGATVTANMLYADGKTEFGANFNPAEVNLLPWGTVTLTYTDDNNLNFAYNSTVAGFGAGNHAYTRLTKLLGTD